MTLPALLRFLSNQMLKNENVPYFKVNKLKMYLIDLIYTTIQKFGVSKILRFFLREINTFMLQGIIKLI